MRRALVVLLVACAQPPPAGETTTVKGLDGPVDLVIDEHGWPHVFASSLRDAATAEGYAMARDRMAQLELFRRTSQGRLAELYGAVSEQFLESDVTMRTIGLKETAETIWAQTPQGRTRDFFEGYAAGVNLYLADLRDGRAKVPRGSELLLGSRPRDWTPVDSLAVLRLMELFLSFNADAEINRTVLRDRAREVFAGTERAGLELDLLKFEPPSRATTLPPDRQARRHPRPKRAPKLIDATATLALLHRVLPAENRLGIGTNAWALSGAHTQSGHALLANDPHLPLVSPSILWGVHLVVRSGPDALDVTGVAFPGVPGVVFGHNARLAWGITNGMFDQMDVYEETVDGDAVVFNGKRVPIESRVEQIPNGIGGTIGVKIERVPHHGPILPKSRTRTRALSVRWVAAEPSHEVDGLISLMLSRDCAEGARAVRPIEVPGMIFVLADVSGDVAVQAAGRVPIRAAGSIPAFVLPGTGEAEWTGWVDAEKLPHASGLPRAVAANNDPAGYSFGGNPFDAPLYLGYDWTEGFRAERIGERLEAIDGTATREDFESVQADNVMLAARRFMPFMLEAIADSPLEPRMREWQHDSPVDSVPAALFHAWLARVLDLTLSDEVETIATASLAPQQRMIAVLALLEHPERSRTGAALWDDLRTPGITETRNDILRSAWQLAIADLTAATGSANPDDWRWGRLHTVRFASVLPHFSLSLGADLTIPPPGEDAFERPGGVDTIDQGWPSMLPGQFAYTQGPARRLTIELTPDGPIAFDALPGGESGDIASTHFSDEAELWRVNRSHALWRTEAEVQQHAEHRVLLLPQGVQSRGPSGSD